MNGGAPRCDRRRRRQFFGGEPARRGHLCENMCAPRGRQFKESYGLERYSLLNSAVAFRELVDFILDRWKSGERPDRHRLPQHLICYPCRRSSTTSSATWKRCIWTPTMSSTFCSPSIHWKDNTVGIRAVCEGVDSDTQLF